MRSATTAAKQAEAVLRANDRGTYTVPSAPQYPHQWNWDSALAALGWSCIDPSRAYAELDSLLAAQRSDGLVPHIAYSPTAQPYVPGPGWWGEQIGGDGRRISAVTHPPLAGICLRLLFERHPDERRAGALLAPLQRWHDWLLGPRDPGSLGEPVIVHPWETGRDNAAEWDGPLERVPETRTEVLRSDTAQVDAEQRPREWFYRRALYLVELFRQWDGSALRMARESPFRVLDPAFSSITAASCADLAWVAGQLGEEAVAERAGEQASRVADSLVRRLGPDGLLHAVDLVSGETIPLIGSGEVLAVLTPGLPKAAVDAVDRIARTTLHTPFGVASLDPSHPSWQPRTYWRGPVWAVVTWLTALGLRRAGRTDTAGELLARREHATASSGMVEYVDPRDGTPLGIGGFTWSAAISLWEAN